MTSIAANSYGKSRVRLVKVRRNPERHDFREWTLNVLFEGSFESAYDRGDNSLVLPTDTMKNTVYSLARDSQSATPEEFGSELVRHFLAGNEQAARIQVEVSEKSWEHIIVDGNPHPMAFRLTSQELQTATIVGSRGELSIRSGLDHLAVMKTAASGFEGFKRDRFTTLRETSDRLLGTSVKADWSYNSLAVPFEELRQRVRKTLLKTFAGHESRSVQHTLYAMAKAALDTIPEVEDIHLAMPNLHCLLVDLSPFGQENPNEIFVPIDEPQGYIEATLKR